MTVCLLTVRITVLLALFAMAPTAPLKFIRPPYRLGIKALRAPSVCIASLFAGSPLITLQTPPSIANLQNRPRSVGRVAYGYCCYYLQSVSVGVRPMSLSTLLWVESLSGRGSGIGR